MIPRDLWLPTAIAVIILPLVICALWSGISEERKIQRTARKMVRHEDFEGTGLFI